MKVPKYRPPSRPGEILLKDFLEPMGITQRQLADALHVPYQRVNVVNQSKGRYHTKYCTQIIQVFWK